MQRDPNAALYVISVAAELAGVHPQTLRIYERKGLLEPARTKGGSRRYSEADLARLRRIAELTEAGVNLEGVRRILDLEAEHAAAQERLERSEAEKARAVEAVHQQYRRELVPARTALVPWRPIRQPWGTTSITTTPATTTTTPTSTTTSTMTSTRRTPETTRR